ncbi:MAG: cobyric acid synthase [Deltaproteobacteria bacterium]|nr:cobyric acid synthase [Deltaproteobacteria bacterium]MBV8453571.1 cobyric acid synthase [Deltaproteobacteria bacterium]
MGTASDVGKSTVTTALCRVFARAGIRVAPFKSQNMSNNAAVCSDGGEIGRAQAVQAQACRLEPVVDMNPVLLKPESERDCQVVIHGQARFHMNASEDGRYRAEAWPAIVRSYQALAENFDLIVIEGAGGAAEVNLRHCDVVNWPIAELADAPVLLLGDIDKGGVLASLVGTVELLSDAERKRIRGFLINKFRGELALLEPGLRFLEQRTGLPVLGVLPYLQRLGIPQEDSAALDGLLMNTRQAPVKIGVIHFPLISNYTDFQPFEDEPDVVVHYLSDPLTAPALDVLILPGTKSTAADLRWLRSAGWEDFLVRHRRARGWTLGICGGYQMLGRRIVDTDRIESRQAEIIALGLLPVETIFQREKITDRVIAVHLSSGLPVEGYEIHAGRITGSIASSAVFKVIKRGGAAADSLDGTYSDDKRVIGTSIHGLFDSPAFRRKFIDTVRESKGLAALGRSVRDEARADHNAAFDRLADTFEEHTDMPRIAAFAGLTWKGRHYRDRLSW